MELALSLFYFSFIFFNSILIFIFVVIFFRKRKKEVLLARLTIIPEDQLSAEVKPYELPALMDENISDRAVLGLRLYHYLHPGSEVASMGAGYLLDNLSRESLIELLKYERDFLHDGSDVSLKEAKKLYKKEQVYQRLMEDGLYSINPAKIYRWIRAYWFWLNMATVIGIVLVSTLNSYLLVLTIPVLVYLNIFLIFFAYNSARFAEDIEKMVKKKAKMLNFKMYIETTDRYRIMHDPEILKELGPYFIIFGIRDEEVRDALMSVA